MPTYAHGPQMGVYQYEIPGVIELENGAREAVVIHLYLKGLQTGNVVTFRGSMFAESAEWEWYNWGGTGLCQPQITANWWPRVFFRCVPCCRLVHTLILVAPVCHGKRLGMGGHPRLWQGPPSMSEKRRRSKARARAAACEACRHVARIQ